MGGLAANYAKKLMLAPSRFSTGLTNYRLRHRATTNSQAKVTDSENSALAWGEGSVLQRDSSYQMATLPHLDPQGAGQTLDRLIDLVADMLPADEATYPELASRNTEEVITFCLRHSALHFSKTAGRLAAFVEDADHGKYAQIQTLQAIVAASLVNSLKLADEIGISGFDIVDEIKRKFDSLAQERLQTSS